MTIKSAEPKNSDHECSITSSRRLSTAKARFKRLAHKILRNEGYEDGREHSFTQTLKQILGQFPTGHHWVEEVWKELIRSNNVAASNLLRCLGCLPVGMVDKWAYQIAEEALKSESICLRDAGVTALEYWSDRSSIDLLAKAADDEPERWLRDYIRAVLSEFDHSVYS